MQLKRKLVSKKIILKKNFQTEVQRENDRKYRNDGKKVWHSEKKTNISWIGISEGGEKEKKY